MAWQRRRISFHGRLRDWSIRAAALAHQCHKHDILVLRYEDLQRDFHGICASLFQHLGISRSPLLLQELNQQTNFSAVTGGRKPGESAKAIVRKGVSGEWKSTLSEEDAARAWKAAHHELRRFGYTENGDYLTPELRTITAGG